MLTVYGFSPSGNCHKLRMLLEQSGRAYRWVETDSSKGATRTPQYLAKNPNGKVPIVELDDGRVLAESNAILCWLAEGTPFMPTDPWLRALTLQWLFFEQYSHEPYIAVARNVRHRADHPRRHELAQLQVAGHKALAIMEQHLAQHPWFVGECYGIADIALYAYTHCAEDGGFELAAYPNISAWLTRVAAQPGHTQMQY